MTTCDVRCRGLDAGFDTRSEDERVPEGGSSGEMELFGASQVAITGQDKGQEILKLTEAIPGVRRGEPCLPSFREAERNSQATCHRRTPSWPLVMRSSATF
jgi:hypothetical protein